MTERYNHDAAAEYVCVDADPEIIEDIQHPINGASLLYFIQTTCEHTGRCPPYIDGAELTCVVCTK